MSTADTLYKLVKTLPEEQTNLVLMFAEFLRQRLQSDTGEQSVNWEGIAIVLAPLVNQCECGVRHAEFGVQH